MLRNGKSVHGCCHGSCCDARVPNSTLRAREKRTWRRLEGGRTVRFETQTQHPTPTGQEA